MQRLALVLVLVLAALAGSAGAGEPSADDLLARIEAAQGRDRVIAVRACVECDDTRVASRLAALARDPWIALRMASVETLGTIGGDVAVAALRRTAADDENTTVRGIALRSLGRVGDAPSFDAMVSALEEWGTRTGAIDGLRLLGDARAFDPVLAIYRARSDDPYVYEVAPGALEALDRARAVPFLLARFAAASPGERGSVARALAGAKDPAVVEALLPALASEDLRVREHAIHALGGAGDAQTAARLAKHGDAVAGDRAAAARAMPAADAATAEPVLLRWFESDDADAGLHAACAHELGRMRSRDAVLPLAAFLARKPRGVATVRALEALADSRDARAARAIAALLEDDTNVGQPSEISSIRGFPHNVRIDAVAAWTLQTVRDRTEPLPREELFGFRNPPFPAALRSELPALKEWAASQ